PRGAVGHPERGEDPVEPLDVQVDRALLDQPAAAGLRGDRWDPDLGSGRARRSGDRTAAAWLLPDHVTEVVCEGQGGRPLRARPGLEEAERLERFWPGARRGVEERGTGPRVVPETGRGA